MRVGCYTLDLYCTHPDHVNHLHGFQFQYTGETYAECARQAKKLGWKLGPRDDENTTEICPIHNGRKLVQEMG